MLRAEAEAIFAAGREVVVEALLELSADFEKLSARPEEQHAAVAEQSARVKDLVGQVDELERQAGRDSTNSSMPPSSDPPKSRAERRRLAREAYKRSMRNTGGQPGHQGETRQLAAPERVDQRF